jgi:hypothetical protein
MTLSMLMSFFLPNTPVPRNVTTKTSNVPPVSWQKPVADLLPHHPTPQYTLQKWSSKPTTFSLANASHVITMCLLFVVAVKPDLAELPILMGSLVVLSTSIILVARSFITLKLT